MLRHIIVDLTLAILLVFAFVVTLTASSVSASAVQSPKLSAHKIPEVIVYWDANYGGESWTAFTSYSWVGSHWNDEISSIVVVSGYWQFYSDVNYGGTHSKVLGPGIYSWVEASNVNIKNDAISSFKLIRP